MRALTMISMMRKLQADGTPTTSTAVKRIWRKDSVKTLIFLLLAATLTLGTTGCDKRPSGYHLVARFDRVQTLKPGDAVIMAGMEIGCVESIEIDPSKRQARVKMHIRRSAVVKIDSTATVRSAPVPSSSFVALDGGSPGAPAAVEGTVLKTRDTVENN
jgi:ABC-type transporter Mla subunit MlaD